MGWPVRFAAWLRDDIGAVLTEFGARYRQSQIRRISHLLVVAAVAFVFALSCLALFDWGILPLL
jgi:hypothetical protein